MAHYLDGKWVDTDDVRISAFDITILRGFGVFDFLRTYNKKPFLLEEHVDRLINSAKECSLNLPFSRDQLIDIVNQGVAKSSFDELYIKIIVTGGVSDDGILPGKPTLVVLFLKAAAPVLDQFNKGVKLVTHKYERYLPLAKSLNYMAAVVTIQQARKQGALDVVYISPDDHILEGTTYNFYVVMNGKVYTAEDDILYGVTRKFLLKIAKENGVEIICGPVKSSQIPQFEEAFITSTTREVMPVIQLDAKVIGDGTPGPVTKKLMDIFNKHKHTN